MDKKLYPRIGEEVIWVTLDNGLPVCIVPKKGFSRKYALFATRYGGMDMRFRSMHEYTAKLPLVKEEWNIPLIGYDTKTNLQSGVIYGIVGELDGIIEKYENQYGNFNVVLTGGNSAYFASQLKKKIFADLNFLYKGLYALSEINN